MYKPTIGLEIHIELKTRTKMFCDSLNDPKEHHPNENVCPVCLGHPGTLPVINKQAVEYVIRMGLALGGNIAPQTKFDRKNYFYPDLPKNYQISQYDKPLVSGGNLNGVRITRVHLEEDAGKLAHQLSRPNIERILSNDKRILGNNSMKFNGDSSESYVDFNRASVPLMELVTEPDIKNADEAVAFAKELQLLARYLGISDADMEKGQMRIEANVSIRPNEPTRSNDSQIESNGNRIVLKDESYRIMGLMFKIHNELGPSYKEKNYQDAIDAVLTKENIQFDREKNIPLELDGTKISDFFADFVVDKKILLEIKATKFITQEDIRQVLRYIKSANLPLGIIVNFRKSKELEYKRVVNPIFENNSDVFVSNSSVFALGTKVEVKNINSFKAVYGAIEYEIKRQEEVLEKGEKVRQETRGWNDVKCVTVSQRSKEEAHDYRYFPEPDLPPFETGVFELQKMKNELPELPAAKRMRFASEYGLSEKQAEILVSDLPLASHFEEAVSELKEMTPSVSPSLLFNYLTSDVIGLMNKKGIDFANLKLTSHGTAHVVSLVGQAKITSRQGKDILEIIIDTGEDPESIIQKNNMGLMGDESVLIVAVEKILAENPAAVTDYKKGKMNALQFLIGKTMGLLKGAADPNVLRKLFEEKLR